MHDIAILEVPLSVEQEVLKSLQRGLDSTCCERLARRLGVAAFRLQSQVSVLEAREESFLGDSLSLRLRTTIGF